MHPFHIQASRVLSVNWVRDNTVEGRFNLGRHSCHFLCVLRCWLKRCPLLEFDVCKILSQVWIACCNSDVLLPMTWPIFHSHTLNAVGFIRWQVLSVATWSVFTDMPSNEKESAIYVRKVVMKEDNDSMARGMTHLYPYNVKKHYCNLWCAHYL